MLRVKLHTNDDENAKATGWLVSSEGDLILTHNTPTKDRIIAQYARGAWVSVHVVKKMKKVKENVEAK